MKFKTNAQCSNCAAAITDAVKRRFPDAQLSLDLESTDKVLHVHGIPENSETAAQVEAAIAESGFQSAWLTRSEENK